DKRFDMYLWGTTNFGGGAGGDWGQRMSDDYILSTVNNNEIQITEHEIGHGFGMPDFYGENDRPPGGFPVPTIMWAGNSSKITDWDVWLLRYTWSQLKQDSQRFRM
ncbi:MAG: dockerin, partial [Paenibacillus macerans]|nr:dockerin [Paenibacillus macerans]